MDTLDIPISQKDRYFRGQGEDEHVLAFCRKHSLMLVPRILLFILTTTLLVIAVFYKKLLLGLFPPEFSRYIFACLGLFLFYFIHHFFHFIIRHHLTVTIFTDTRIVVLVKSLYFVHEKEMVDLKNIQEVKNLQNGLLESMFNFGDLYIILASTTEQVHLRDIPNPEFHFRLINKAKQALADTTSDRTNIVDMSEL